MPDETLTDLFKRSAGLFRRSRLLTQEQAKEEFDLEIAPSWQVRLAPAEEEDAWKVERFVSPEGEEVSAEDLFTTEEGQWFTRSQVEQQQAEFARQEAESKAEQEEFDRLWAQYTAEAEAEAQLRMTPEELEQFTARAGADAMLAWLPEEQERFFREQEATFIGQGLPTGAEIERIQAGMGQGLPTGQEVAAIGQQFLPEWAKPQAVESDPEAFIQQLRQMGQTPEAEGILRTLIPTVSEGEIQQVFKPEIPEEGAPVPLDVEIDGVPVRKIARLMPDETVWLEGEKIGWLEEDKFVPIRTDTPELAKRGMGAAWKTYLFDAKGWQAIPELWRGVLSTIGFVGSYAEKYVGRPFEVVLLEKRAQFQLKMGWGTPFDERVLKRYQELRDKYGWAGALVAPEVSEIWEEYLGKAGRPARVQLKIAEWLNPAYLIPIGGTLGFGARITSRIPIIGKVMERTAAGVQFAEAVPFKPIEFAVRGAAKGAEKLGGRLGNRMVERLVEQSKVVEPLLKLPDSHSLVNAALEDNWQRSAIQAATRVPVLGKAFQYGIEKGLGWRMTVRRVSEEVEDIVGRAAVVHAEVARRGPNAEAVVKWELQGVLRDPVSVGGWTKDNAFSERMFNRLLPEHAAEAEIAGTVEHVFTHPGMYNWDGLETLERYVYRVKQINDQVFELLTREGVALENVGEDWWLHRVVTGKLDSEGELITLRGRPGAQRRALGARQPYEMRRKAPTMAEGMAWGIKYNTSPEVMVGSYVEQAFKKIADARFVDYVTKGMEEAGKEFGEKLTERLTRYPELFEEIPTLEGRRLARRAVLRADEMKSAREFEDVINRALRGERISAPTLKALQRRFPELAPRLKRAMGKTPSEGRKLTALLKNQAKTIESLTKKLEKVDVKALRREAVAATPDEVKLKEAFRIMEYDDRLAFRSAMQGQHDELGQLAYEHQAEISSFDEFLREDPIASYRGHVGKRSMSLTSVLKGGQWPETVTKSQARMLLMQPPGFPIPSSSLTREGRVKIEYVLDELSDHFGMSENELMQAVERVAEMKVRRADLNRVLGMVSERNKNLERMLKLIDDVDSELSALPVREPIPKAEAGIKVFRGYSIGATTTSPNLTRIQSVERLLGKPGKAIQPVGVEFYTASPELARQYASQDQNFIQYLMKNQGKTKVEAEKTFEVLTGRKPIAQGTVREHTISPRKVLDLTDLGENPHWGDVINRLLEAEGSPVPVRVPGEKFSISGKVVPKWKRYSDIELQFVAPKLGDEEVLPIWRLLRNRTPEDTSAQQFVDWMRANGYDAIKYAEGGADNYAVVAKGAVPKAEAGMPEAGLQQDMFGYQTPHFPKSKGNVTQISMDDYNKLVEARKAAGLPPPDVAVKPKIEGVSGLEADTSFQKVLFDVPVTATREAELKALRQEVRDLIEARKGPAAQAKAQEAFRRQQARQPDIGQGYIMQPFAGGKIYDREFIDAFNKFFGWDQGLGVLRVTSDVAGILRITKAALDLSFMAIQGMPSWGLAHTYLLFDPKIGVQLTGAWYRAFLIGIRGYFDMDTMAKYIGKRREFALIRVAYGGSARVLDYFATLLARSGIGGAAERLMQRIPLKPYHRAENAFLGSGEMVRDEFWRILSPRAAEKGQLPQLARFLDRITGIYDSAATGVPLTTRQLEQTFAWFAPNYTRACLTVIADIFRGGYTGAEARKAIGGMITAGAMYYSAVQFAIAMMEGKDVDEAWQTVQEGFGVVVDPITGEVSWKPTARFMSIKVGNYYMGFGGFWYGMLRLAGNVVDTVQAEGERERIDLVRIFKNGGINRDNPFIGWWYNRSSPLVGIGFDLWSGRDFLDYPLEGWGDYAQHILTRFEPIWMEQGINWMIPGVARDNEIPEGAARAAIIPAELLGLKVFPEGSWTKFYDRVLELSKGIPEEELDPKQTQAWRDGKLGWKQLTEIQQWDLFSRNDDLRRLYDEAQGDSAMRDTGPWKQWNMRVEEERATYYKRGVALLEQLKTGDLDTRTLREQWGEAGQNYGVALDSLEREPTYSKVYDFFAAKQADGSRYGFTDDVALGEYQVVLFADYLDVYGNYDWDARDRAVAEYMEKWGPEIYDRIRQMYADKKQQKGLPDVLTRLSDDKDKLGRGYWQLPYTPIYKMTEEDFEKGKVPEEYRDLWQQYQAAEDQETFLEEHPDMEKDWKAEWRLKHPEDDARLALWGYGGKLQTQEAYDLVLKWGRELGIPLEQMGLGLPPPSLSGSYFEHARIVAETSPNSVQTRLYKLEHPDYLDWGVENEGWNDLAGESLDALRLRDKWNDDFSTPEAKDDMRRVTMYDLDIKDKGLIEEYVLYGQTIDQFGASSSEARLFRLEHPEIDELGGEEFGWSPIEDRPEVLRINIAMSELSPDSEEYARLARRKDAYQKEIPETLIDSYVAWRGISGYASKRYLQENQSFYQKVYLGILGREEVDFSKVPTERWEGAFDTYDALRLEDGSADTEARLQYRRDNTWFDDEGVTLGRWKAVGAAKDEKWGKAFETYDSLRLEDGKADREARLQYRRDNPWFDEEGVRLGKWKPVKEEGPEPKPEPKPPVDLGQIGELPPERLGQFAGRTEAR